MSDNNEKNTFPQQASACRKGGHIVINDRPCKIIDMSTSKTGKHGHAKVRFVAIDIFNGKKIEMIESSTHNVTIPVVTRAEYQLIDIDTGYLSLMDNNGDIKEDVQLPEGDLGDRIQEEFDTGKELLITIQTAMGDEQPISFQESK